MSGWPPDQLPVGQPLPSHHSGEVRHLAFRVLATDIVPSGELVHVAVQVLFAQVVIGAMIAALEHRPERLDPVGVRHSVDIFADRVLDGFVRPGNAAVCGSIIRIDRRSGKRGRKDKTLQGLSGGVGNGPCTDLVGFAVLHADNGRLAYGSPARIPECLAPGVAHVPALAAHVGLIGFHRAAELRQVFNRPGFTDALEHEPGGFLRYADVPVEFHAGHALETGQVQMDGDAPFLQGHLRPLHDGPGLDRKEPATVKTTIRERVAGFPALDNPLRSAMRAFAAILPHPRFKPSGRLLPWETSA